MLSLLLASHSIILAFHDIGNRLMSYSGLPGQNLRIKAARVWWTSGRGCTCDPRAVWRTDSLDKLRPAPPAYVTGSWLWL